MTYNKNVLNDTRMIDNRCPGNFYLPDGNDIEVSCIGSCDLEDGSKVTNVLYIPKFQYNLLKTNKGYKVFC